MEIHESLPAAGRFRGEFILACHRPGEPGGLTQSPGWPGDPLEALAVDWLDFNGCVRSVAAELCGPSGQLDERYGDLPCVYLREDEVRRATAAVLEQARDRIAAAGRGEVSIRIETRADGGYLALVVSGAGIGAQQVLFPLEAMEEARPIPVA